MISIVKPNNFNTKPTETLADLKASLRQMIKETAARQPDGQLPKITASEDEEDWDREVEEKPVDRAAQRNQSVIRSYPLNRRAKRLNDGYFYQHPNRRKSDDESFKNQEMNFPVRQSRPVVNFPNPPPYSTIIENGDNQSQTDDSRNISRNISRNNSPSRNSNQDNRRDNGRGSYGNEPHRGNTFIVGANWRARSQNQPEGRRDSTHPRWEKDVGTYLYTLRDLMINGFELLKPEPFNYNLLTGRRLNTRPYYPVVRIKTSHVVQPWNCSVIRPQNLPHSFRGSWSPYSFLDDNETEFKKDMDLFEQKKKEVEERGVRIVPPDRKHYSLESKERNTECYGFYWPRIEIVKSSIPEQITWSTAEQISKDSGVGNPINPPGTRFYKILIVAIGCIIYLLSARH